jgi:hypothetical protein
MLTTRSHTDGKGKKVQVGLMGSKKKKEEQSF